MYESVPNEDKTNRQNKGVLGETFTCLFALEFLDLKRGDRFFYENAPSMDTSNTAFSIGILLQYSQGFWSHTDPLPLAFHNPPLPKR